MGKSLCVWVCERENSLRESNQFYRKCERNHQIKERKRKNGDRWWACADLTGCILSGDRETYITMIKRKRRKFAIEQWISVYKRVRRACIGVSATVMRVCAQCTWMCVWVWCEYIIAIIYVAVCVYGWIEWNVE